MLVKNTSGHDITFMFQTDKGVNDIPHFDTVNIVAGWTVDIPEKQWEQVSKQTKSILSFKEEEVKIEHGNATIKGMDDKKVTPTKIVRTTDGTAKVVNLVDHLIKTRQIEYVQEEEAAIPPRELMESFLKRYGEKVTEKMTDEDLMGKVKAIKAELEALKDL